MREPTDSLDPVDWFVYSDWLYDQGKDQECERAGAIGRGLVITEGVLWLQFSSGITKDKWLNSTFHTRHDEGGEFVPGILSDYHWNETGREGDGDDFPRNPITSPNPFRRTPLLVRLYWDKLAQIGKTLGDSRL